MVNKSSNGPSIAMCEVGKVCVRFWQTHNWLCWTSTLWMNAPSARTQFVEGKTRRRSGPSDQRETASSSLWILRRMTEMFQGLTLEMTQTPGVWVKGQVVQSYLWELKGGRWRQHNSSLSYSGWASWAGTEAGINLLPQEQTYKWYCYITVTQLWQ